MIDKVLIRKLARDVLRRVAFNKENPTALMGQLIKVLNKAQQDADNPDGLQEALDAMKSCGITTKVNDGWRNRNAASRVVLVYSARKVADRVPVVGSTRALGEEARHWGEEFSKKRRATFEVAERNGETIVRFRESYENGGISYALYGLDSADGIKWSSEPGGRNTVDNLPREIERLVNDSRNAAIRLYEENSRDWAQQVAWRSSAMKEGK